MPITLKWKCKWQIKLFIEYVSGSRLAITAYLSIIKEIFVQRSKSVLGIISHRHNYSRNYPISKQRKLTRTLSRNLIVCQLKGQQVYLKFQVFPHKVTISQVMQCYSFLNSVSRMQSFTRLITARLTICWVIIHRLVLSS